MLHSFFLKGSPSQGVPPHSWCWDSFRLEVTNCPSGLSSSGHGDQLLHCSQTQSTGQQPSLQVSVRLSSASLHSFPPFLESHLTFLVSILTPSSQVTEHLPQSSDQSFHVQLHL